MAATIDQLKVHVANSKRKITNFAKFVDEFVVERDLPILEKRKTDVDKEFAQFEKCQLQLDLLAPDSNSPNIHTEYEEKYYAACSKAIALYKENFHNSDQNENNASNSQNNSRENQVNVATISKTVLPRINLPSFSGSYESWLGFHDLFKSLVDNDKNISDIEKLYHLKGCLQGEAAQILASIELSAENYKVAWDLLRERYDNRKVILQTHVNALLTLPVVSKDVSIRSLIDQVQRHIRALEALKEPVDQWDTLLIGIIRQKLNSFYCEKWEDFSNEIEKPTFRDMTIFLQRRAQFEDNKSYLSGKSQISHEKKSLNPRNNYRSQQSFSSTATKNVCPHCQGDHLIYHCESFKKLSPSERFEEVKKLSLCINCLRPNHRVIDCKGNPCRKCNKKHNILLHFEKKSTESTSVEQPLINQSTTCHHLHDQVSSEGLLATAMVDLVNSRGEIKTCRAFLDAGSQSHCITDKVANFLQLPKKRVDILVSGVDETSTKIDYSVSATLKSKFNNYSKNIEFLVLNKITKSMPMIEINCSEFNIPKNIKLADVEFYKPSEIDILIGVKLFYKLMCVGQISLKNHPDAILQKTQLGWIVAGELKGTSFTNHVQCHVAQFSTPLEANLSKFWDIEEISPVKFLSPEEQACKTHFVQNTHRNSEGRYVVRLPFNNKKEELNESRSMALKRFHYLEKRFEKDSNLKSNYCAFLKEYEDLNHLSVIKNENSRNHGYYLPHHAVIKEDSLTTKVRVVFDGSAKSSSGVSLNDTLMVGPTIQDDLFTIVTRFRSHKFAFTADIEKMYRQILVHQDDAVFQKILFREDIAKNVQELKLNTVTYGTSCAPFLAIRTLHHLADDEKIHHPTAASVVKKDFYVDDILTGANTLQEAAFLRADLISLLKKGGFHLTKWSSNEPSLIIENSNNSTTKNLSFDSSPTVKTLGIQWNSFEDFIFYKVNLSDCSKVVSKRSIFSQVAKLFDPLGLLGPVIVKAKIMIQLLWKAGVSWDSSIPIEIHTMWLQFKDELPLLENINFQRFIHAPDSIHFELHCFCDASEKAYGACIYLRSTDAKGNHHASLVCSKSRVAPVNPLTLPRLELSAALLLVRLYVSTKNALPIESSKVCMWSDSTITLNWVNTEPHLLKTFVANRVVEIQQLSKNCEWKHVPTKDNPADLVSRGISPQELLDSKIWKNGPSWLVQDENTWPHEKIASIDIPEKKKVIVCSLQTETNLFDDKFVARFSSFKKLLTVISYILRFTHNIKNKSERHCGHLTLEEIENAKQRLITSIQSSSFSNEIRRLKFGKNIENKSRLIPLNPFLDGYGILRVGGRLVHANLPENSKHQILLPPNSHVTRLIIRDEHERLKHEGTQATLYSVREIFWPLDGKNITRKIIYQCIRCFRAKPRDVNYLMGNLPQERISSNRPFLNVGVDYCGPFYIKEKRHRNKNKIKVYVCIFVCMSTKAVHLELVNDLTSESFLACLKRLFSRRGIAQTISSDNAKNFVGASRELLELYKAFQSSEHNEIVKKFLAQQNVIWNFIPPRSPHFGGLWEAAVKSFKHHLLRTVGNTLLTFDQLETCIIEIEAILNSRPLSPMSSDPNDLQSLTPGHFLIGGPLTSFPQMDLTDTNCNRLSAWENAQRLRQHFWKRWHKEYLHQLTVRSKWQSNSQNAIQIGTLVVMKEDNLAPLQWSLGRIIATHPGPDGVVRVATVKTNTGEYKRCIKKLCPLPIEELEEVTNLSNSN